MRVLNFTVDWRKVAVIALCVLAALPLLRAAIIVVQNWVPLPVWDAWQTPASQIIAWHEGRLTFADLFRAHNEHRIFFPLLLTLALVLPFGWDFRVHVAVDFLLTAAALWLLLVLVRRTIASALVRAAATATLSALLFAPRVVETGLTGLGGATLIPAIALLGMLVMNASAHSLGAKTIVNAALALVATYSFASGMLVWVFGFPLEASAAAEPAQTSARMRRLWRALYVLAAAGAIGGYFVDWKVATSSSPATSMQRVPALVEFLLTWLSNLFLAPAPALLGGTLLAAFLGLCALALSVARRSADWPRLYPWIALGFYTLAVGALVAHARLGFGEVREVALSLRYTGATVFFYAAITGLTAALLPQLAPRSSNRRIVALASFFAVVLLAIATRSAMREQRDDLKSSRRRNERLLLAMRFAPAVPQNPDLLLLNPYPNLHLTIERLAQIDALRPRPISAALAATLQRYPGGSPESAGVLDVPTRNAQTARVQFTGWAWLPDEHRRADCVVIGYDNADGSWTPFTVAAATERRRDLAPESAGRAMTQTGFKRTLRSEHLPPGARTFRACAVDEKNERVWPLNGAVELPPP